MKWMTPLLNSLSKAVNAGVAVVEIDYAVVATPNMRSDLIRLRDANVNRSAQSSTQPITEQRNLA